MAALTGMKTELMTRIEQVNTRIDQTTSPQTIANYGVWNNENLSAWEHPGYIDPTHEEDMQTLADANAAREVECLTAERAFRALNVRLAAEKRMLPLEDNEVYLERWYSMCLDLVKSMHWDIHNLSKEMDDTIINSWRCAETILNVLRWTKETSQYGRSTSNYGTCKEHLMRYMIIMHMSPYDTYGSM